MFCDLIVLADSLASCCQGLYVLIALRIEISGCAQSKEIRWATLQKSCTSVTSREFLSASAKTYILD